MKLHKDYTPVESSSDFKTSKFTLSNSPKLFSLLSEKLYKDKISSIIRELSCNAADSHVQAGNSEPFEVNLPSKINPIFSVKDYGVALSPEEMDEIYTSYGESTKGDSNELIGAFGLGSKTPFAYVQSFSVVSIQNGLRSLYTAFIGEDGVPALTTMGSEPTSEANSFEVFFPVKDRDFHEFRRKAVEVLSHFRTPVLLDAQLVTPKKYNDTVFESTGVAIQKPDYYNTSIVLQMGHVNYVVDKKELFKHVKETPAELFLMQWNIFIDMPIGGVEVTVSREDLSYSEYTIKAIRDKITYISNIYKESLENKYTKIENGYERATTILSDFSGVRIPTGFFEDDLYKNIGLREFDRIRVGVFVNGKYRTVLSKTVMNSNSKYHLYFKTFKKDDEYSAKFPISNWEVFIFNEKEALWKMENEVRKCRTTNKRPLIISVDSVIKERDLAREDIKKFIERLGSPDYTECVIKKEAKPVVPKGISAFVIKPFVGVRKTSLDKINPEKSLYVYLRDKRPILPDGSAIKAEKMDNLSINLAKKGITLIAIRKTEAKHFTEVIESTRYLYDYIDEAVTEFMSKKENVNRYVMGMLKESIKIPYFLRHIVGAVKDKDVKRIREIYKFSGSCDSLIKECLRFTRNVVSFNLQEEIKKAEKQIQSIRERYKLLKYFNHYNYSRDEIQEITDYVNLKYIEYAKGA